MTQKSEAYSDNDAEWMGLKLADQDSLFKQKCEISAPLTSPNATAKLITAFRFQKFSPILHWLYKQMVLPQTPTIGQADVTVFGLTGCSNKQRTVLIVPLSYTFRRNQPSNGLLIVDHAY